MNFCYLFLFVKNIKDTTDKRLRSIIYEVIFRRRPTIIAQRLASTYNLPNKMTGTMNTLHHEHICYRKQSNVCTRQSKRYEFVSPKLFQPLHQTFFPLGSSIKDVRDFFENLRPPPPPSVRTFPILTTWCVTLSQNPSPLSCGRPLWTTPFLLQNI